MRNIFIVLFSFLFLATQVHASYIQGASSGGGGGGGSTTHRYDAGNCTGTKTLNIADTTAGGNGPYQAMTQTGDCTIVLSNPDALGGVYELELAEGGFNYTWPTNVRWSPSTFIPSNSGKTDLVNLLWNGTWFMGSYATGYSLTTYSNVNSINWGAANTTKSLDLGTSFNYENTQAMTFSTWVAPSHSLPTSTYQRLFDNQDAGHNYAGYTISINPTDNHLTFQVGSTNATYRQGVTTAVVTPGAWHHVAMTWDGAGGTTGVAQFYIDGSPVTTTMSGTSTGTSVSTVHMYHGQAADNSNFFSGNTDEPAIFNIKFSAAQVATDLYASGVPQNLVGVPESGNLQGWWRNGDPADSLTTVGGVLDRSSHSHNATCLNCISGDLSTSVP